MPLALKATAPVLVARDVAATARWYQQFLGFQAELFGECEPYDFAILCRDEVEIMLRRCGPAGPPALDNDWNVYIRSAGVLELASTLEGRLAIEGIRETEYGCCELTIADPNGCRLVFSERMASEPAAR